MYVLTIFPGLLGALEGDFVFDKDGILNIFNDPHSTHLS